MPRYISKDGGLHPEVEKKMMLADPHPPLFVEKLKVNLKVSPEETEKALRATAHVTLNVKGDEKPRPPKSIETRACQLLLTFVIFILVLVAIVAPVYAFTVVSCVSTSSCKIVSLLGLSGATCAEGDGERSAWLTDGEKCTPQCPTGLVSTVSVLECVDGVTKGAEEFMCMQPKPSNNDGAKAVGLVQGAITGGELATVCRRATNLRCAGGYGTTATLIQLQRLQYVQCEALLKECRTTNAEFEFMTHNNYPGSTTLPPEIYGIQEPPLGVCSLGCWNEWPILETTTLAPIIGPDIFDDEVLNPGGALCGGEITPAAPICLAVKGSCNLGDNQDYYRDTACAVGFPQWVTAAKSHRIRYDKQPTPSQGGVWILEYGFEGDATLNTYGEVSARQDSFAGMPILSSYNWYFRCVEEVDFNVVHYVSKQLVLTLGECSCTRDQDCSGHGDAVGSKTYGPQCSCRCDRGWTGATCATPLCRSPQVYQGENPSCEEGDWIWPGAKCTPKCREGFQSTNGYEVEIPETICLGDASGFSPALFYCTKKPTGPDLALLAAQQFVGTTTPLPACAAIDCNFRGNATGKRRADGSCQCKCLSNYVGRQCLTYSGSCSAPVAIENADRKPCTEGTSVSSTCSARCMDGYYPMPAVLICLPGNNLEPEEFKCFGGPPLVTTWCSTMKNLSIGTSVGAGLALLCICVYNSPVLTRKPESFVIGTDRGVELEKDAFGGEFYVVRCEGKDQEYASKLPDRIKNQIINGDLQSGTNHISATEDRAYDHAKHVLAEQSYLRGEIDQEMLDENPEHEDIADPNANVRKTDRNGFDAETMKHLQEMADEADGVVVTKEKKGKTLLGTLVADLGLLLDEEGQALEEQRSLTLDGADEESWEEDSKESFGAELAIGLPGSIPPEEPGEENMGWHLEYHAREEECQRKRYEEAHDVASKNHTAEQQHIIEEEIRVAKAVEETVEERDRCEEAIQAAMKVGDGEALRKALDETKALLVTLEGAPVSITNMLTRLVKLGEGRYEQYYERNDKHASHKKWLERIKSGRAADWHMTDVEFWEYAEAGNLPAVEAGLKAFLPVLTRSPDGQRLTILHLACKPACREAIEAKKAARAAAAGAAAAAAAEAAASAAAAAAAAATLSGRIAAVSSTAPATAGEAGAAGAEAGAGPDSGAGPRAGYARTPAVAAALGAEFRSFGLTEPASGADFAEHTDFVGDSGEPQDTCFEPDPPAATNIPHPDEDEPDLPYFGPSAAEVEAARLEIESSRLGVIKVLLKAKASPNTGDIMDRTPLDLAVSEGGPGSEDLPIFAQLTELGLVQLKEAATMFAMEAAKAAAAGHSSRLTGNTPKPKSKGPNPNPRATKAKAYAGR